MRVIGVTLFAVLLSSVGALWLVTAPDQGGTAPSADDGPEIAFTPSADKVEAYDFLEVTLGVRNPSAKNPFTDVSVSGQFRREGGDVATVEGFCDAADGGTYRIRCRTTLACAARPDCCGRVREFKLVAVSDLHGAPNRAS